MEPMKKLQTVLDLYLKHRDALGYGLVTLLTAGGERLFSAAVFQCPCSAAWNLPYGLVFLLVPALALFLLGYVLSARTWRLLTGCCKRGAGGPGGCPGGCTGGCTGCCAGCIGCCSGCCPGGCGAGPRGAQVCAQLTWAAALAPLTWVAVALLGGSFYECAASGSGVLARRLCSHRDPSCAQELPLVPCQRAQAADVQALLMELKAQSQILGWILIATVIVVVLIVVSVTRCVSPVSFLQLSFWKIYVEQEQKILKSQATENATELAKENVKCFFEGSPPKEVHTPSMKAWQQISSVYTFNPKNPYYSMLHKHVHRTEKGQSIRSSEGDEVVHVLDFVDKHDMHATDAL